MKISSCRSYNSLDTQPIFLQLVFFKLQSHDAIYRLRFYSNSLIHILSLSNLHNNVASIQKNRGDKSHRVIVALLIQFTLAKERVFCISQLTERQTLLPVGGKSRFIETLDWPDIGQLMLIHCLRKFSYHTFSILLIYQLLLLDYCYHSKWSKNP